MMQREIRGRCYQTKWYLSSWLECMHYLQHCMVSWRMWLNTEKKGKQKFHDNDLWQAHDCQLGLFFSCANSEVVHGHYCDGMERVPKHWSTTVFVMILDGDPLCQIGLNSDDYWSGRQLEVLDLRNTIYTHTLFPPQWIPYRPQSGMYPFVLHVTVL